MGPSPSQNKANTEQNQSQPLIINHPRFNNLKVVSPPTEDDEGVIQIIVPLPNEIQFKKWEKKIAEITQSENIFIPIKQKFQKTEFCGSGGLTTISFKYYPYLLRDEVINRCSMEGKFFEEAELWYLVYSIIQAAGSFHSSGQKIGDVRPQNVFISPEGQVRVATQFSWPNEQTNYLKTVFEKEITYLSPQELKDISYGKLEESANLALNESFSIGLTCLDAATLTDSSKLYQSNNKFNYGKLEQHLETLQKNGNYSPPLILIIKGLCQVEGQKRITCKQLASWLNKYQGNIVQLQEFDVDEIPQKLHKLQEKATSGPKVQPFGQYQNQAQNIPPFSTLPSNYISAPINRPQFKYTQQSIIKPGYLPQQFTAQGIFPQIPQSQYNSSGTYINGGGPNIQRQTYGEYIPISNSNPSAMTFQKEVNTTNGQPRGGNFNLQQIDQQLQMSRKLFPS